MVILLYLVVLVLAISALCAIFTKDLLVSVVALGVNSLIVSALFFLMHAPDVAITEAAIGAGLSTAIYVFAIRHTKRQEEK
ncbi:DUF4040 domain-containing protein [candidate division WOR-3 bacterium]|uniref:MrpA C-terminal/MbhD domain-containing protein n=1 Tax=candidate division TA06 bacterium TaxID=2250710 RepID=A0A660SBT8_UNCT6|nr:DUF4040 domain-containing protein [candidate division WOR-3 bacterium]RKX67373.1 MAG: hypothetical protein DRP44_02540 [candidate division TA06 bacterium]